MLGEITTVFSLKKTWAEQNMGQNLPESEAALSLPSWAVPPLRARSARPLSSPLLSSPPCPMPSCWGADRAQEPLTWPEAPGQRDSHTGPPPTAWLTLPALRHAADKDTGPDTGPEEAGSPSFASRLRGKESQGLTEPQGREWGVAKPAGSPLEDVGEVTGTATLKSTYFRFAKA